jgi:hypothetical protein
LRRCPIHAPGGLAQAANLFKIIGDQAEGVRINNLLISVKNKWRIRSTRRASPAQWRFLAKHSFFLTIMIGEIVLKQTDPTVSPEKFADSRPRGATYIFTQPSAIIE